MTLNLRQILYLALIILLVSCKSKHTSDRLSNNSGSFSPGQIWLDDSSKHINAHGGGILFYEESYYWFGEFKAAGRGGNLARHGVSCYSSKDLYNWKNEGVVLHVDSDTTSEITTGCVMERPKVIHNKKTNTFVMWFHLELKGQGYSAARTGLAVSNSITGPFKYVKSFRPNAGHWPINLSDTSLDRNRTNFEWWTPEWRKAVDDGLFVKRDFKSGQMSRDMTLFVDDDGKAYHIHSSEENLTLHISELTNDYQDFTGKWIRVFPGGHNEAPALFKRNEKYYMITSGCTGWEPNEARSAVSESIWGPWEPLGNPCWGADSALTFYSQSTFVLPVQNKRDSFIFMADRWTPENPVDGRYIWLPIEFSGIKPVINYYDNWDLSIFKN